METLVNSQFGPGKHQVSMALQSSAASNACPPLDLSHVHSVYFFVGDGSRPRTFLIQKVYLE